MITDDEVKYFLSGGELNENPNNSLGGVISSTEISSTAMNNAFDTSNGTETAVGRTEFRGFYVKNTSDQTLFDAKLFFINLTTDDNADVITSVGLGTSAVNATEQTITDDITAPSGVTFSIPFTDDPVEYTGGLSIGDLPAGATKAFWIKRQVIAGAPPKDVVNYTVSVKGDTGE